MGLNVNVRQFGAKGDGVADDQPAIQAALEYVGLAGGGVVYMPPGTYRIDGIETIQPPGPSQNWIAQGAPLQFNHPNITLLGAGPGATTLVYSAHPIGIYVQSECASNPLRAITLRGFRICSTWSWIQPPPPPAEQNFPTGYGVIEMGASESVIRDVVVDGAGSSGITIGNPCNPYKLHGEGYDQSGQGRNIQVRDCVIRNTWEHGFYVAGAHGLTIENVTVLNPRSDHLIAAPPGSPPGQRQNPNGGCVAFKISSAGRVTVRDVRVRLLRPTTSAFGVESPLYDAGGKTGRVLFSSCHAELTNEDQYGFGVMWGPVLIASCAVHCEQFTGVSQTLALTVDIPENYQNDPAFQDAHPNEAGQPVADPGGLQVLGLKVTGDWPLTPISISPRTRSVLMSDVVVDKGPPAWTFDLLGSKLTLQNSVFTPGVVGGELWGMNLGQARNPSLKNNRLVPPAPNLRPRKYDLTGAGLENPRILDRELWDTNPRSATAGEVISCAYRGHYVAFETPLAISLHDLGTFPDGHTITFKDESGQASEATPVIIQGIRGAIDGLLEKRIVRPYAYVTLIKTSSGWFTVPQ